MLVSDYILLTSYLKFLDVDHLADLQFSAALLK